MLTLYKAQQLLGETKKWLKNQVIQEVPVSLSPCEFDCHRTRCTYGNVATCRKCQVLRKLES
jgi:hypothetical protein